MRSVSIALAAAGLLMLTGCGKEQPPFGELHPVSGTITTAGGQAVKGGSVQFMPEPDKPDFLINSDVGGDGSFELSTVRTTDSRGERKAGAPAGTYRVVYTPNMGDQTAGFKEPVTLPRTVTVEAKANKLTIALPAAR